MSKITLDADTFRALASSTRLTVLKSLDERRKTLTELSRDLALNKATVHEHMALLTAAGLVRKRDDEGRKWIYYELTWTGQRILHPEATTTFNLLLALSVAAAGGGVAMLGRALGWWMEDTIANRPSDGAEDSADRAFGLSGEGAPENAHLASDSDTGTSADTAASSATGDPSGTSAPSSGTSAPASQSSAPQSTSTSTQASGSTTQGSAGGAPAAGSEPDQDSEESRMLFSEEADGDGGGGDSGLDSGPHFFDDGGWIGLALLITCALFLGLAFILQRKFVAKPLDEASAASAETGTAGPGQSPPRSP